MFISVVICTWNRAKLLDQTLLEMTKAAIPPEIEWELIVVNNNCSDETDQVVDKHSRHLPIKLLHEKTAGKCFAANRAVAVARGELILWTDDDVLVDRVWLAEYVKAAQEFPDAAFFGGPIEPWFETAMPNFVIENLEIFLSPFALRQLGTHIGPLPERDIPFGANMAIRRKWLESAPFDTRIGYVGKSLVGGEDTTLLRSLIRRGAKGVWVGTAPVRHFVPRSRATYSYLWRWHEGHGRYESIAHELPVGRRVFGLSGWALRAYLYHRCAAAIMLVLNTRKCLDHYTAAARAYGALRTL